MKPAPIRNVYVHAPFCARRCCYCDFAVEVNRRPDSGDWLSTIRMELESLEAQSEIRLASTLDTLYVGGGTPSVLEPGRIAELAGVVGRGCADARGVEWTVEANPESFTLAVAESWARGGVNRVSFGVQSFSPDALRWMGRLHSAADAEEAVRTARAVGMANLSVDLIFGLPASASRSWEADLDRAVGLEVPHVSLYGLTVEKGTPLARAVREGRAVPAAEGRYRDEYLFAAETLARAGYLHYEVSNFAFPGRESRHNQACWKGAPYLGLGNGAHSYSGARRWWNERDWTGYRDRVRASGSGRGGGEALTPGQSRMEAVWLALRTREGLDAAQLCEDNSRLVRTWVRKGLARRNDGAIRLTPEGWLILDDLALELEAALEPPPGG